MRFKFSSIFLSDGINYFDDQPLTSTLKFLNFSKTEGLNEIGKYVGQEMMEDVVFLDHFAKPELQMWGVLDDRIDSIWISRTHSLMIDRLLDLNVVNSIYSGDLMYHFISGYLISDAGLFCTLTLTAQTLYGLSKYGNAKTSKYLKSYAEDGWLGATYYTEIQGGSDLGANTTLATKKGDHFVLNGENKYFASNAGLADGAIVTARTENSVNGAKGISAFFVPAVRDDGSKNYELRRIKDKLGTILVPTGEVLLKDSEGFLLGKEGEGIYVALEILEVSRIDDAISAVGIARKALWEAYLYSKRREAFGRKIYDHPLIRRDLVEMEAEVEASMVLSLIAGNAFKDASNLRPPYDSSYHVARALTHLAKNMCSWSSDYVTRYSMEILGGKGFLKEFPMEKFHRDSIVTSMWEGTSNIQALDFLEILSKKHSEKALFELADNLISSISGNHKELARRAYSLLKMRFLEYLSSGNAEYFAKDILNVFANTLALLYLILIGEKQTNDGMLAAAEVFYYRHFADHFPPDFDFQAHSACLEWMGYAPSRRILGQNS
ncbi:MAG: acyl-CoA dehydrogenase family protein [Thermoplasmatales archaeon]